MRERLAEAIKTSMKSGDKARLSTLRLISARIKDADLAAQGAGRATLGEAEIVEVLAKMVKQRRESIEQFKAGNRPDLVAKEEAEIAVIQAFMPKGLSEGEVAAAIDAALAETGAKSVKDMGKVMALLKDRFTGRMDFGAASGKVKARLG